MLDATDMFVDHIVWPYLSTQTRSSVFQIRFRGILHSMHRAIPRKAFKIQFAPCCENYIQADISSQKSFTVHICNICTEIWHETEYTK